MSTLYLTGSSGGLGRVIRQYYLERGWSVVGFDLRGDEYEHSNYLFVAFDSADEKSVEAAFLEGAKRFGAPRALIATIGGIKPWASIENVDINDFLFVLQLNLTSAFIAIKHAVKLMKPSGVGSIVTIGAETALRHEQKKSAYVAAKAAVIALTQEVALETKEYGVNTNCIVPNVIHTKANEEWGTPEEMKKWTAPDDIAALCYHLSSESGRAINGSVIRIPNKL
jgi:NAD(P)-dependent dehydrogenase (short-subunit alcohol dehydrogenase family)